MGIEVDVDKYISDMYSSIVFYRKYFRFIKPSKIYVVCYYDRYSMAAFYAAKEMGIPVIEVQHGLINKVHFAYIANKLIEPNPYPDYLFCFSETFKNIVSSNIYKSESIFVTGRYYIDLIKMRKEKNYNLFLKKHGKFKDKIIITVADNNLVEIDNKLLDMIKTMASSRSDIMYIYKPRIMTENYLYFSHPNVTIEEDLDVYQCMQNSHITTTVASTIAMESLVFGTPVILLNINNLAKMYLSELFSPVNSVYYADTTEEYLSYIPEVLSIDRSKVAVEGTCFYADNHAERIKEAIETINDIASRKK
ncbi:hypothetical protein AGMMS49944_06150 [Spirochaetia bacterium]|nr:hypothetical protein AGMMS49944_06150 [Spirochaetia bacterium]